MGFPWCTAAGLIFGITQSMRSYYGGPGMVLGSVGAFPVSGDEPNDKILIDVSTRNGSSSAIAGATSVYD